MKYLTIIFSLYMTLLTLMPCQDREDVSEDSKAISAVKKTSNGIEHYTQEACPPFCTCACCSVSRHFPIANDQSQIIQIVTVPFTVYRMATITGRSIDIYQPPRIA